MCGIAGYVGYKNASDVALGALERLSYKGADSAGVCVSITKKNRLAAVKTAGNTEILRKVLEKCPPPDSRAAIAHIRLATHGAVSDENSHPHGTRRVMLVQNGIVENYLPLKQKLISCGYSFKSDTDAEVAALLIDYFYEKLGEPCSAIKEAASKLQGSFAIAVMFADIPDTVFALRHEIPLFVGIGDEETFIASDIPVFLPYTRKYFRLADFEIAKLELSGVTVYNKRGKAVKRNMQTTPLDVESAARGGFSHFMRKEIAEERSVTLRLGAIYSEKHGLAECPIDEERLKSSERIVIFASGSAYHTGLYLKYLLEKYAKFNTVCAHSSDFASVSPAVSLNDTVILISKSGTSPDTIEALSGASLSGAYTVGIVNVVDSPIALEADTVLYSYAGLENALVSTKTDTAQCTVCAALAVHISRILGRIDSVTSRTLSQDIKKLPELLYHTALTEEGIRTVAEEIKDSECVVFAGMGGDLSVALEGAFKLAKLTGIRTLCPPADKMSESEADKIMNGAPVVALFSEREQREKMLNEVRRAKKAGAKIIALSPACKELDSVADFSVSIPDSASIMAPVALATAMRLLAYHTAVMLNKKVDK